jgi:transcriptional regulator with XRE-family HTH domain
MEVYEKIKFIRLFKGWSQEEMAEKLQMTPNGYAKIEQGKVDINLSRLEKISETLGVELAQLVGLNNKNVFNFIENHDALICFTDSNHQALHNVDQTTCKYELEKTLLILEQKDKEIEQKDKEIVYLKEINKHELEKAYLVIEQKDKEIVSLKETVELMK